MKKLYLFVIIFSLLLGIAMLSFRRPLDRQLSELGEAKRNMAQTLFPEAQSYTEQKGQFPYIKILGVNPETGHKEFLGFIYSTLDIVPDTKGFVGPINIMVGVDPQGTIAGLHVVSHHETSSYVASLGDFIKQFVGLKTSSAFKLGEDIDGISQATITSQAIIEAVHKSLMILVPEVLGQKIIQETRSESSDSTVLKEKLRKAGIQPREAKYWRAIKE
ncbi:MAG: FMN-binding protein [Candidatus Omnitrophota bacterium]